MQAVEVAQPNATYEIVVKTAMTRGTTIPKGRVNFPREAKPKRQDKILVFASGELAQQARDSGADIVGGEELIEGVRLIAPVLEYPFYSNFDASFRS